jgi:hypothetical protein
MRDKSEVAKMTEKMKTVCVGRYLIDVPVQAEVSLSHERIDGFDFESAQESEDVFRQRIAARVAELEQAGEADASRASGRVVESRDLRVPGLMGKTILYGRTRSHEFVAGRRVDVEWVSVEAHAHAGGTSFTLSAKYVDEADARAVEALLARLQLRREEEIPAAPGFCVSHAVFAEPLPLHRSEQVAMHLGMPEHPDLALSLLSVAGGRPGQGLLARYRQMDAGASPDEMLRVSKLRSDQRSINGLNGEEIVERIREFNFTTTYTLNWETRGENGNLSMPFLSLEAQAGAGERPGARPAGASLHEDALLALWDSVASSIRLRRNDPPSGGGEAPAPAGPALGAMLHAGDVCTQAGWWRCAAAGPDMEVHGGQVQYIPKGERMPQALLLPRQTLWQKLKRIQPSMKSPQATAWTLVDKRQRPRGPASPALASAVAPAARPLADAGMEGGGPAVAVGTYVRTGDPCPASGWWRCVEPQALDGARWFAEGSLLPAATFRVPAGVFARASGPETIQRRSGWQLMRLAGVPTAPAVALRDAPAAQDESLAGEPPALA